MGYSNASVQTERLAILSKQNVVLFFFKPTTYNYMFFLNIFIILIFLDIFF